MFNTRTVAMMMAIAGFMGCETVPNKERLDANEKEALDLCKQIKEGKLHGSYNFGENNNGVYGEIAISVYDEKNKKVHSYAFKRNEKGWFDKVESVRPAVMESQIIESRPLTTQRPTKWVPYTIPAREL